MSFYNQTLYDSQTTYDNPLLSNHYNYMTNYVGGNNKQEDLNYIKEQTKIIQENNKHVPQSYTPPYDDMYTAMPGIFGKRFPPQHNLQTSDRYDPLGDFLFKKGLMDRNNSTSYTSNYLNIDSSLRNKYPVPRTTQAQWIKLENSPLRFTFNSNTLEIIDMNNQTNFVFDDKIMLTGVQPIIKTLTTLFGTNNNTKLFEFTVGSKYMKINYKHLMKFPDNYSDIVDYDKYTYIENYDTAGVNIQLAGIQGENGTNYIGNISINTLNDIHQVLLYNPDDTAQNTYSDDSFYIELTSEYISSSTFVLSSYNVELTYYYIAGIPINQINAEYPINVDHAVGYHRVLDVTTDSITINIPKISTLIDDAICADDTIGKCAGGNNVYIAQIQELLNSYPYPNHYSIILPKTFSQIVYIRLVSSEFPNTQRNITSSGSNINNKLYWQNLEDGDIIYNIDIDQGNYTPITLKKHMEQKISQIKRTTTRNISANNKSIVYLDNNIIKINIDEETSIVTFTSFTEAIISKPFTSINPPINDETPQFGLLSYTITITQIDHRLNVGDYITIFNSLSYMGIPSKLLNSTHQVTEIIDNNNYTINISNFNLESSIVDNGGGLAVHILTPNIFRLRFDYTDTVGTVLGFREVGTSVAITYYNSTIKNNEKYEYELSIDEDGNNKNFDNNPLAFTNYNYLLMSCKQIDDRLDNINYNGNIKKIFAKILLPDNSVNIMFNSLGTNFSNKTIFNSFVCAPVYFHDPIRNLNELEFTFYTPNGDLFDFNGKDHSFTLEIVTMADNPKGTGITSFSGKIN